MKKKLLLIISLFTIAFFIFSGCASEVEDKTSTSTESTKDNKDSEKEEKPDNNSQDDNGDTGNTGKEDDDTLNPVAGSTKAASLDFIFNNQTLGITTITIKRSEWNTLCDDYRYFYKNENCVHVESYEYEKDGKKWKLNNVGFRLRGNTSRFCPQGVDNGDKQEQMNVQWTGDYYAVEGKPNDHYRQVHFKVDFEEFLEGDEELKMSDCMKGVALKRMDASCAREIFCYNLFRQNGIWTVPRASHTRVLLNIIEDNDKDDPTKVTKVDYGVYEMFEEVNKQSLKARESGKNNKADNAWKNNKGNLWKCQNDLTDDPDTYKEMGVEDIRIIHEGEAVPASDNYKAYADEYGGNRIGRVWDKYMLDLKTNKTSLDSAKSEFTSFIKELNALPDVTDNTSIATIKAFYEKWFDVDFFIKTYAVSMICGMDDDYWGNANNYYLYFDTASGGSGKLYFIPFDYDNTLGASIKGNGIMDNPMAWGRGEDRPLIDKLLLVPEYEQKFKDTLIEVLNNKYWDYEACSKLFLDWGEMVRPYLNSPDLNFDYVGTNETGYYGWKPYCSLVDEENNLYDMTRNSFTSWINGEHLTITQDKDYTGPGFKIKFTNVPENAAVRDIDIDGMLSGRTQGDKAKGEEWVWPYALANDPWSRRVFVSYYDENWNLIEDSNTIVVTSNPGEGDFFVYEKNKVDYKIEDNKLKFTKRPTLLIGNKVAKTGKYRLQFNFKNGDWLADMELGDTIPESVNLNQFLPRDKGITPQSRFEMRLYYEIRLNPEDWQDVYNYDVITTEESKEKDLHLTSDFYVGISEDAQATLEGLNIKILESEIPDDAYSRNIYVNDRLVAVMDRIWTEGGSKPAAHIKDTTFNYPWVEKDKKYKVSVTYTKADYSLVEFGPIEITPADGKGELQGNEPAYGAVTKNRLNFRVTPKLYLNDSSFTEGNFRIEFNTAANDDWIDGFDFPEDGKMNLNELFRGKSIDSSVQFVFYLYYQIPNNEGGFNYRYEFITKEETKKNNLKLNKDIADTLTWDSSSNAVGLNLRIFECDIPDYAYEREFYVNDKLVSRMSMTEDKKPNEHINDTTWSYPYVNANQDYTVYVKYLGEWRSTKDIVLYESEEFHFTPTTGQGEANFVNKNSITYSIVSNKNIEFSANPSVKIGDSNAGYYSYKYDLRLKRPTFSYDEKISIEEIVNNASANINFEQAILNDPDLVGKTDDQIYFALDMILKTVGTAGPGYDYRYRLYTISETQEANLRLTGWIRNP